MKTSKDRFWSKVIKTPNCWEWIGTKSPKGYGRIGINYKKYFAHRIAFELEYGKIPDGLCVLHHCDNPSCVRPDHLFLGTIADNNRDSVMKGRSFVAIGEGNGNSKLKEKDILLIRILYNRGMLTNKQIAKRFNVNPSTIGHILKEEIWRHII